MGVTKTLQERLGTKITVTDGCWEWTGAHIPNGYGVVSDGSKNKMAHRAVYELFVGPIAEGLQIDHLCRNRNCVNPAHLEPVTTRVNVLRGVGLSAKNAVKTHCKRGHEFTPENTYPTRNPSGPGRECRTCKRAHHLGLI